MPSMSIFKILLVREAKSCKRGDQRNAQCVFGRVDLVLDGNMEHKQMTDFFKFRSVICFCLLGAL